MEVVGSPRRFDGNLATWEPCEPLMNVFREKVTLTIEDRSNHSICYYAQPIVIYLCDKIALFRLT